MPIRSVFQAVALVAFGIVAAGYSVCARAEAPTRTFTVAEGASPWYDRVGTWALTQIPASLSGNGPIPQQSCSSRSLDIPPGSKSIVLGVSQGDLDKFQQKYPSARASGETIAVKNPTGAVITYGVMTLADPPARIDGAGVYGAGLLLLKLDSAGYKPAAAAAMAPVASAASSSSPPGSPAPVASATATIPRKKSDFRLYLLMGQSNMVGRDTSKNADQIDNPRILALDPNGRWVVAREPMHAGGTGMGPGTSFAAALLKANPKATIGLIPCAVGGTPLSRWMKGADLYERAVQRARLAANDGLLCGALWHQGETDSLGRDSAETYGARLKAMFIDLRADLAAPKLPIVIGQLGEYLDSANTPYIDPVRAAIADMPKELPRVAVAPSTGLTDKGDHLHFTADSEIEFGKRYAAAMIALQKSGK